MCGLFIRVRNTRHGTEVQRHRHPTYARGINIGAYVHVHLHVISPSFKQIQLLMVVIVMIISKVRGNKKGAAGNSVNTISKRKQGAARAGSRRAIRPDLSGLWGGRCYVYGQRFGRRFQFHHVVYRDGKSYRDFATPKQYVEYLAAEVRRQPEDFYLLCHPHHYAVKQLKMQDATKFRRPVHVVEASELGGAAARRVEDARNSRGYAASQFLSRGMMSRIAPTP